MISALGSIIRRSATRCRLTAPMLLPALCVSWHQQGFCESATPSAPAFRPLHILRGHPDGVRQVRFSGEAKHVMTVDSNSVVRCWSAETGKQRAVWKPSGDPVKSICFDSSGRYCAVSTARQTIVWDCINAKQAAKIDGTNGALSSDGRFMVTTVPGKEDQLVWASPSFHGLSYEETRCFFLVYWKRGGAHASGEWTPIPKRRAELPNGVSVSRKGTVQIRVLRDGCRVWREVGQTVSGEHTLDQTKDGMVALVVDEGRTRVRAFSSETGRVLWEAGDFTRGGARVVLSLDERHVLVFGSRNEAEVRQVVSGAIVSVLHGHEGDILDARYGPRGALIVTGSADGTARIWSRGENRHTALRDDVNSKE